MILSFKKPLFKNVFQTNPLFLNGFVDGSFVRIGRKIKRVLFALGIVSGVDEAGYSSSGVKNLHISVA